MAGVNKVILVGNLGADPEARSLNNGGEVVNMRVATSEKWKDRDGNRQEQTEWHNVVDLQREPRPRRQELFEQGLEGLSRRPDPDPQVAGPVGQRPLHDRGRAAADSAASWCCSTAATAAAAAAAARSTSDFGGDDFGGGAPQRRSRARSRRRSTPTSTTTFRSRSSSLVLP